MPANAKQDETVSAIRATEPCQTSVEEEQKNKGRKREDARDGGTSNNELRLKGNTLGMQRRMKNW